MMNTSGINFPVLVLFQQIMLEKHFLTFRPGVVQIIIYTLNSTNFFIIKECRENSFKIKTCYRTNVDMLFLTKFFNC